MLEMSHIAKTMGGKQILGDVTLRLGAGKCLCLAGPSGQGKTTILEIAAGLLTPEMGRVCTNGRIGYMFQDDALIPWHNACQNICFALAPYCEAKAASERAEMWLDRLGLGQASELFPAQMSGGMKRRLNLARALAVEPDILLLDEPFAFLDEKWQKLLAELLASEISIRHTAVLMVSHQMKALGGLACRLFRISQSPIFLEIDS